MACGNSKFKNLLNKFGLEDFDFKFDDKNNCGIGYNKKDDVYCVFNTDGNTDKFWFYVKELYFFKKNENGSFDSVNYNGHCYFYYDRSYSEKSKIIKEENETYVITSSFNVLNDELTRKYLDINIFKNIYLDVEELKNLNLFNDCKYHIFKNDRPNKLRFEKGKLKSKIYINCKGHCDKRDGPAVIIYGRNGELKAEFWCKEDHYHREDGPAQIFYDCEGTITEKLYYYKGKKITDEFELSLIQVKENLNIDCETTEG